MNKNKLIPIGVFVITFIVFIVTYVMITNHNKNKYSCYDAETDTTYTFKTEEEMHQVCDNLTTDENDKIMDTYEIYNDLLANEDSSFSFYPYINSDKKLSIIIAISDCENPTAAKTKAENWFKSHSYDINDYTIVYEYPCNIE